MSRVASRTGLRDQEAAAAGFDPLGSPWDAVQMGAQAWVRETGRNGDSAGEQSGVREAGWGVVSERGGT